MSKTYEKYGNLEVKSLAVRRGHNTLISDLSFTLAPGDTLWVKGGNGIGKTSLLNCCAGLLRPHAGEILWDGSNIFSNPSHHAAYQGHMDCHKPDLTLIENLEFWCDVHKREHDLDALLNRVDLWSQKKLRTKNLSAGQSRRLALARLVLCNAPLWILDEPGAAMDVKGRDLIEELLHDHIARNGSVLLASHGAPARIGANTRILTLKNSEDVHV